MIIYSLPAPQMVDSVENKEKLLYLLTEGVKKLERAGADFIVIACNTVHYFLPQLRKSVSIPVLSIIEEVSKKVNEKKIKKIGLLATTITIRQKLYDKVLKDFGISIIIPNETSQKEIIKIIRNVIAGKIKQSNKLFLEYLIEDLKNRGAEGIVLGCTDLPIILSKNNFDIEMFDSTNILAEAATDIAYGDQK